jgi:hypothetical protein
MKATLEFDLSEERAEFEDAMAGTKYRVAIESMWAEMFRPLMKHGYSDRELAKLMENNDCVKVVEMLADMYNQILKDHEVEI